MPIFPNTYFLRLFHYFRLQIQFRCGILKLADVLMGTKINNLTVFSFNFLMCSQLISVFGALRFFMGIWEGYQLSKNFTIIAASSSL